MVTCNLRGFAGLAVMVALLPSTASAQTTPSLGELGRNLLGDTIFVTDDSGNQTKGRVIDVSASHLVVSTPERRTFEQSTIREIRRPDGLWNGLAIGFAAGLLPGAFLGHLSCEDSDTCTSGPIAGALAIGGIGAAIGVGIDELVGRPGRVIFAAAPQAKRIRVLPSWRTGDKASRWTSVSSSHAPALVDVTEPDDETPCRDESWSKVEAGGSIADTRVHGRYEWRCRVPHGVGGRDCHCRRPHRGLR